MSDMENKENTENPEVANESAADAAQDEGHTHDHDHDHGHHHDHDHDHDHDHGHGHGHGEEPFVFEEDPVFDVNYKGECAYEVKVSVPAVNFTKQSEELFKELKDDAVIPGFRRGKAPIKLVQNKFGKAVRVDAFAKLVEESFRKLVRDKELRPLNTPQVPELEEKVENLEDGQALEFTLEFEVAPRCELGQYRGIEVERPFVSIKDEDITRVLDGMRERQAMFETVEDGAADGDQALIDFEGKIDGEPFDGNSAENYPYIMGSGRFLSEFEAALAGRKAGETVEADVTFPEDWRNAAMAGKVARFSIKVNEVKRRKMPEMNEEFAKSAGFESVEDMRAKVAEELKKDTSEHSDSIARRNAIGAVIAASSFEIPASLIASMTEDVFSGMMERRRDFKEVLENPEEEAKARAEARETALGEIKEWVAVQEIAEAEGMEITEADLEKEASALSARVGVDSEVAKRWLVESERRNRTEMNILMSKVTDLLLENAKIVEKELKDEEEAKEKEADA